MALALAPCVQPPATAAVPPLTIEGLTASFDESGVLIQPTDPLPGLWNWRYSLTTFGRAGLALPALPPVLTADAEKRELVRPGLREAYEVKDTIKGFEQTFIIEKPPAGEGPILLEGRVTTDLKPEGGIRLPNRVAYLLDGLPQLQYANLAVRDATGRALAARMDWTEDGRTISLWIDEEGKYPITVDPGIGGCSCTPPIPPEGCWCTAVGLCVGGAGTDCVDPMHAALSPLNINGSVGGAAFFYRTLKDEEYDGIKMVMLGMSTTTAASAPMQYGDPLENQHLACSGHSFLPDGRLFIAGGQFGETQNDHAYIWRNLAIPPQLQNALQATSWDSKMCGGPAAIGPPPNCAASPLGYVGNRWYPTTIPLWDGRIMVIGGKAKPDPFPELEIWNNSYEFYSPAGGVPGVFYCNSDDYRVKGSNGCNHPDFNPGCKGCWDYPHYHAIPEGLLFAAPLHSTFLFSYTHLEADKQLWVSSGPFLHQETESRFDSASVMLEVDLNDTGYNLNQQRRVLLVGGDGDNGNHLDSAEVFDAQATPPRWRWTCTGPSPCARTWMQKVRKYPKTVLLPNNRVLIVGGEGDPPGHPGEKTSEIFDPSNETFGSPLDMDPGDLTKNRRYHSQAFLLPDGRVITAGDDFVTNQFPDPGIAADANGATYNVYYPTYMSLASARPAIIAPEPPTTIEWDPDTDTFFDVCVSGIGGNGADFDSVIMVRPGSTTHSVEFDHRQVRLPATNPQETCGSGGNKIHVTLPAWESSGWKKHVLPPGYYMLIVRKKNGGFPPIPSVAKFVKLETPPPPP